MCSTSRILDSLTKYHFSLLLSGCLFLHSGARTCRWRALFSFSITFSSFCVASPDTMHPRTSFRDKVRECAEVCQQRADYFVHTIYNILTIQQAAFHTDDYASSKNNCFARTYDVLKARRACARAGRLHANLLSALLEHPRQMSNRYRLGPCRGAI